MTDDVVGADPSRRIAQGELGALARRWGVETVGVTTLKGHPMGSRMANLQPIGSLLFL